jgi:hypothetical protein
MKRAILIATGTVGGLGAVLAITPPTFTSTESSSMALPGTAVDPASTACDRVLQVLWRLRQQSAAN